jgi:hypothetical protein
MGVGGLNGRLFGFGFLNGIVSSAAALATAIEDGGPIDLPEADENVGVVKFFGGVSSATDLKISSAFSRALLDGLATFLPDAVVKPMAFLVPPSVASNASSDFPSIFFDEFARDFGWTESSTDIIRACAFSKARFEGLLIFLPEAVAKPTAIGGFADILDNS